jgi:hypothetical protein
VNCDAGLTADWGNLHLCSSVTLLTMAEGELIAFTTLHRTGRVMSFTLRRLFPQDKIPRSSEPQNCYEFGGKEKNLPAGK